MSVLSSRDFPTTWSTSVHSLGQGSKVYSTLLEEFPKVHGDTVDDEHNVSSVDRWSVGEDHTGFRGHAARCIQDLKGSWEEHLPSVEFAYNNSYQTSIQMTPYEAL